MERITLCVSVDDRALRALQAVIPGRERAEDDEAALGIRCVRLLVITVDYDVEPVQVRTGPGRLWRRRSRRRRRQAGCAC